jgi:hypothetical protein
MGLPKNVDERARYGEDLRNLQRVKDDAANSDSAADREIAEQLDKLAELRDVDDPERVAGS